MPERTPRRRGYSPTDTLTAAPGRPKHGADRAALGSSPVETEITSVHCSKPPGLR